MLKAERREQKRHKRKYAPTGVPISKVRNTTEAEVRMRLRRKKK